MTTPSDHLSLVTAVDAGKGRGTSWTAPIREHRGSPCCARLPVYSPSPKAHQGGVPCLSASLTSVIPLVHTIHKGFPPHPLPQGRRRRVRAFAPSFNIHRWPPLSGEADPSSNRTCGFPTSGSPTTVAHTGRDLAVSVFFAVDSSYPRKGRSAFLGLVANRTLSNPQSIENLSKWPPFPFPPGCAVPYGTSVLCRPPTPCSVQERGLAVIALPSCVGSWTSQGLTGSVTVLSFGAIPKHPTGYAVVLLVPSSLSAAIPAQPPR